MELATQLEGNGVCGSLVELSDRQEHVYDAVISPDGKYIAAILGDGSLLFLDSQTLRVKQGTAMGRPYDDTPSTAVQWLPRPDDKSYMVVSASSSGGVFIWRWDGDTIERTLKIHEKDNEIMCLALTADGEGFLTAGSDRVVRFYSVDGTLKGLLNKGFGSDGFSRVTHTNRIFSVCFVTPTIAVSGGWGSPIQVWDIRSLESRLQLVGTQIAADGIEPIADTTYVIVTSKRSEQQLQVFDCISGEELETESARISAGLMNNIPLISRYCKNSDLLWTITSKPCKLLVTSFLSGELVGSCDLPVFPMNIRLSEHFPRKAFVSCADGKIFVATAKT